VVLSFFVGNDVTGIPIRGKIIRGRKYYTGSPIGILHLARQSQLFMLAESLFVRELRLALLRRENQRRRHAGVAAGPGAADGADSADSATATTRLVAAEDPFVSQLYLKIMTNNMPVFRREPDRKLAKLWTAAEDYLLKFDRVCREAELPWLLLFIPSEVQVDLDVREKVLAGLEYDPAEYDFDLPQRRLVQFAQTHDLPYLDVLPAFREAHSRTTRLYKANDTHWNERGNRLAGELVAAELLDWVAP